MIGIRHAKLTKCQMLDWIKSCVAEGQPTPSDEAIVDRFNLSSIESARILLADLADEGGITIRIRDGEREIVLGPREHARAKAPERLPNVARKKRAPRGGISIEEGASKVFAILGHREPGASSSEAVDLTPAPAPAVPADGAVDPKPVRLPTAPGRKLPTSRPERRQLNLHLPAPVFRVLEANAKGAAKPTSSYAREFLIAAVEKPFIPADVVAAAIRADRPVCEFALGLLAVGLDEYRRTGASG